MPTPETGRALDEHATVLLEGFTEAFDERVTGLLDERLRCVEKQLLKIIGGVIEEQVGAIVAEQVRAESPGACQDFAEILRAEMRTMVKDATNDALRVVRWEMEIETLRPASASGTSGS